MMVRPGTGGPFGTEPPVPTPPREPRSRRWKLTFLAIVLAFVVVLAVGGTALAHSMGMAGSCGGV